MQVVSISGSPDEISRSRKLLDYCGAILQKNSITHTLYSIHDFKAPDVLFLNCAAPALTRFITDIEEAAGIIIATPIYKASFSGILKILLDVLPQEAFKEKIILPFANAGSPAHLLALDYALKPVLNSMKANEIMLGVAALDTAIDKKKPENFIEAELKKRIDHSIKEFIAALNRPKPNTDLTVDFVI